MKMNRILVSMAAVCAITLLAASAWAQNQPQPPAAEFVPSDVKPPPTLGTGKGQVILTWDEFVKVTGYDPNKSKQTLTIPLSEVETLLGMQLKDIAPGMNRSTVELPWQEFRALLEWSVAKKAATVAEVPPPTEYIFTSSKYEATISPNQADVVLTVKINVLKKTGWKRIPVLPAIAAVTDSKLPEGVFLNNNNGVYELLTDKTGPLEATLNFSLLVNKNSGISTVMTDRVLGGSSVLDLTFTEQVDPKVSGAQSLVVKNDDGKTKVAAAIPASQPISISWERFVPKPPVVPAKLYAETQTLVAVSEGLLACQESVDFSILHSPVEKLKLSVPKGAKVLEVSGRNIQDWRVDDATGELNVQIRGEAIGSYNLRISYEYPIAESPVVPVIQPLGVEREKGYVGVIALTNVEITSGAVQTATTINVKDLPPAIVSMTNQPILLAFRSVGQKFAIPLVIKKHGEVSVLVTVVDSAVFTTMQLDDGRRMTRVIYSVRNNRNQFLRVTLPTGAQLWSVAVSGNTVTPGADDKSNMLIPLIRSADNASELASFPVELVYVETPTKTVPSEGKLRVAMPRVDQPTMHVMVNYYAPSEGKYGKQGGLFSGSATSGFSGSLQLTDKFAEMVTDNKAVVKENAQQVAQNMQKQFESKVEAAARATGSTPIRVRLPIEGRLFKLEKILALQGDELFFDVEYSDWKAAK